MKMKFHALFFITAIAFFSSCKEDNYDEPKALLSGKVVYKGEPIGVEYNQVRLQLWQPGWGKLAPIDVEVAQDASYSAMLFNGNYKMVFPVGQGPFMTIVKDGAAKDILFVEVNGDKQLDVEVLPFYMIRTPKFSASERKVTGSLSLEKVITDANAKKIERVSLYVNKTDFVSGANNIVVTDMDGATIKDLNAVNLTAVIPDFMPTQNYVFARIGVKIAGVEDLLFSPIVKVQL